MTQGNWLSFAFSVVAVAGSLAHAAAHGRRTWRAFGSTSSRLTTALDEVSAAGAAAEQRALSLSTHSERLASAVDQLDGSLAELAVLRRAAREPGALLASIRGLAPRK